MIGLATSLQDRLTLATFYSLNSPHRGESDVVDRDTDDEVTIVTAMSEIRGDDDDER